MSTAAPRLVLHVLSLQDREEGSCWVRASVRLGDPEPGGRTWFLGRDGKRRTVTIGDLKPGVRHLNVLLRGDGLDSLYKGAFLYGGV